jgi:hypothetical protein
MNTIHKFTLHNRSELHSPARAQKTTLRTFLDTIPRTFVVLIDIDLPSFEALAEALGRGNVVFGGTHLGALLH